MLSSLSEAIRSKSVVTFVYRSRRRYVEPHILDYDQEERPLLSAWRLTAVSDEDFRGFRRDSMSGMTTTARFFPGPRARYNPNDRLFSRILRRL